MDSPIIDIVPATPVQRGLLYIERSYTKSSLYHEQFVAKLTGSLDVNRLMVAWQKTVDAHTILRTIFDWDGQNEPMQIVLRRYTAPFITLSHPLSDGESAALISQDAEAPFSTDTTPPHRVTLIEAGDGTYRFVLTYHHLLLDGASVAALLNYLAQQYNQSSDIHEVNDYGVYSRWIQNPQKQASIKAWRHYAASVTLPSSSARDDVNDQTHEHYQYLESDDVNRLIIMARANHLTLNSIFQIIWAYTLAQSRGETSVCVGSPTMIKPLDGSLDSVVGLCINTLPYIVSFNGETSLIDIARQHQRRWGGLIEHSQIGLAEIKKAIDYQHYGDPFETILAYTDARDRTLPQFDGMDWQVLSHNEITQYLLSLDVVFDLHSIELKATYRDDLFDATTISRLIHSFAENIRLFVDRPETVPYLDSHVDVNDDVVIPIANASEATIEAIAEVWTDVFGVGVGLDSNFFELGGDSISSLRIVSKLLEASITVSMRDVFDSPTPRLLAQVASSADVDNRSAPMDLPHAARKKARQLYGDNMDTLVRASSVQQGILERPLSKQSLYHDQSTFTYEGRLDPKLFEEAWNAAIKNSDAMRMQYFSENEVWYACALKERAISMEYMDLRTSPEGDLTIRHAIEGDLLASFNLQDEPLVRLRLYRTGEETYVLFLSFHILISDGWSFAFMMDDVFTAYEQLLEGQSVTLPDRRPVYVDYLQSLTPNDSIAGRQHWKKYLQNTETSKGVAISDFSNLELVFAHLNEEETDAVQQFANTKALSLNSVVQAAWAAINARQSEPFIFGATTSARLLHGVHYDRTVGLFFNDVPIVARVEGNDIQQLANAIQRDFQTNAKYSYISSYDIAEMMGRGSEEAPYDSLVVFENYPKIQEDSLKESRRGRVMNVDYWRRDMADIPVTIYVEVRDGKTTIKLSYNDTVVSRGVAQDLIDNFVRTLKACTA